MLKLTINQQEHYDEETNSFITVGGLSLELEHSLLSLSKWESKHQKPFLDRSDKTLEELLDYIACMVTNHEINPEDIKLWPSVVIEQIQDYINSSQSATTFGSMPTKGGPGETITSELIYYWLVAFNIPFVCENWHLNRLFSLIKIANIKNSPPKKMSRQEVAARNREINARRKAELGTKG